jgi:flagellar biosynthetic protein FliR
VNPLEALIRPELLRYSLELTRIAGVIAMTPLAWSLAPLRFRVALALLLAVVVHGPSSRLYPAPEFHGQLDLALAIAGELLLGLAFGFVVRLSLTVGELVGEVVTPAIGLGAAQIFDPMSHVTHGVVTTILRLFSVLLALVLGLHRVAIGGLIQSFQVLPVGNIYSTFGATEPILLLTAELISCAVRIALPVLAVVFVTNLALAFVARAAPAIQVFSVGFAITLAVGLLVLTLVLPDLAYQLGADFSHVGARLERLLAAIGGLS